MVSGGGVGDGGRLTRGRGLSGGGEEAKAAGNKFGAGEHGKWAGNVFGAGVGERCGRSGRNDGSGSHEINSAGCAAGVGAEK